MTRPRKVDLSNAQIVARDEYGKVLESIIAGGFCPFCTEHLNKHHKKPILFKNPSWVVTLNGWPYEGTRHHFLLISKQHVESAEALTPKAWQDLGSAMRGLRKRHGFKGATLLMRSSDTSFTGATVQHLHAQVIVGSKRGDATEPIRAVVGFKRKKIKQ